MEKLEAAETKSALNLIFKMLDSYAQRETDLKTLKWKISMIEALTFRHVYMPDDLSKLIAEIKEVVEIK